MEETIIKAIEEKIPGIVEKLKNDNRFYWRTDDFCPKCGGDFENSTRWDDNIKTEESLGGLSCSTDFYMVGRDTPEPKCQTNTVYCGRYRFAIAGEFKEYGEDEDEVIVRGHGVLAAYDTHEKRMVYVNTDAVWPSWGY